MSFNRLISFVLAFWVFDSAAMGAETEPCDLEYPGIYVQFDINFAFQDATYNTEMFHKTLDLRVDGHYVLAGRRGFIKDRFVQTKSWFLNATKQSTLRTCWRIDGTEKEWGKAKSRLINAPTRFRFGFGPRTEELHIPEIANMALRLANQSSSTPLENDRVLKIGTKFNIGYPKPDWFSPLVAKVVELVDGSRVLRIKTHNSAEHEIRDVSMELTAYDGRVVNCASTGTSLNGIISLRKSGDDWNAIATNLEFGGEEIVQGRFNRGPCGELDFSMTLGSMPPVQPKEDHYVSYKLTADPSVLDGEGNSFWNLVWVQTVVFNGSNVWPRRLQVKQKCPDELKEKLRKFGRNLELLPAKDRRKMSHYSRCTE